MGWIALAVAAVVFAAGFYLTVVSGRLTIDLGIGRRVRQLGPISRTIAAPTSGSWAAGGPIGSRVPGSAQ